MCELAEHRTVQGRPALPGALHEDRVRCWVRYAEPRRLAPVEGAGNPRGDAGRRRGLLALVQDEHVLPSLPHEPLSQGHPTAAGLRARQLPPAHPQTAGPVETAGLPFTQVVPPAHPIAHNIRTKISVNM